MLFRATQGHEEIGVSKLPGFQASELMMGRFELGQLTRESSEGPRSAEVTWRAFRR